MLKTKEKNEETAKILRKYLVIVCFLEKNNLPLSPYSGYKLAYKPIQGQKKVGIKQAAERENEFHKTLTFNTLQMGNRVILTISSDYWKRTFFLKDKFPITKALTIKSHIANHVKLSLWEN